MIRRFSSSYCPVERDLNRYLDEQDALEREQEAEEVDPMEMTPEGQEWERVTEEDLLLEAI